MQRNVNFCLLIHSHMSSEECVCVCVIFLVLFLDDKNKICTTPPEAHAMFYFPMIDKQVRGSDGFTACFLLVVSWLDVLWWMWLLSMLLCLSRDHCVFKGRVRGGAVGSLELE